MRNIVINRDIDTDRLSTFRELNAHVPEIGRFSAIGYDSLNIDELFENRIIDRPTGYTHGALGSAMSHILLWNAAAEMNEAISVFEDDAVLCHNFTEESSRIIAALDDDWDIILWGYNYDVNLTFDVLPGVSYCVVGFNQTLMRFGVDCFRGMTVHSAPFRLFKALGICSYAISPKGARRFLDLCLPLKDDDFYYYRTNETLKNTSLDQVMCHHYEETKSYCCFPSLCITPNEHSRSTVRRSERNTYVPA
ncbi:glycosyltransferase family 25 protein [Acetobacter oeni]|uniref:Glycosyl transferase family 25 domain-containing protein n=1 Tax=Acetobacter oeni TaxID=304077 RepID=A0A511XHP9_9PROT|nr:glycosyltransferase family 25 protein [Acetobacter oeni]MBB3882590.1 GR25 family glycosyltransferase involved in LPS biosynthesis [Acetobacter oeni]NHO18601.1 glycosyl transferase family 25 [Acetobacter oeni]GBR12059.1 glycosyltransferase [Acetobacter oeni LMG 21952]GEN62475.1 hypothetical protein AOE01nite_06990 [Acetobacter oeni]